MNSLLAGGVAIGVSCLLLWLLRPLALRIGLVDQPGERKRHNGNVALIGGIAMFCGLVFSVLMLDASLAGYRSFFAAATLLIIVGILDDFHELPTWSRFAAQFVAALIMSISGGVFVNDLGAITGGAAVELNIWAIPFTIFATIGVINAWNMSDGLDGLAGGLALVAFLLLGIVALSAGRYTDGQLLFLLVAVVGTFLLFNMRFPRRKQALVFMGDAGSMFLGFTLAWFAISLSQGENRAMTPVTALWILALPLIDAVSILLRRMYTKRPPFSAATDHMHHILLQLGCGVNATVGSIVGSALALGILGLIGLYIGMSEQLLFFGFLGLFASYLWVTTRIMKGDSSTVERVSKLGYRQKVNTPAQNIKP
ncbi:MAG: undecaprenyl/decaprenyl-phosphate alpha-N-acetylglucosaminyl 1-phosphate transferase [Gammaproteobacteria bacterium]|nr:undecaprenyl/decaprenyl-phosphate alpha-N-acetylglucosaminyl 1-phosphate transferase [Gammaproteobacteria bacterium]